MTNDRPEGSDRATLWQKLLPPRIRSVFGASLGTVIGSWAGMVLPFAIANAHGVGREADVYFVVVGAIQLIAYLVGLVAEAAGLPVIADVAAHRPHQLRAATLSMYRKVFGPAALVSVGGLIAVTTIMLPAAGINVLSEREAALYVLVGAPLTVCTTASGLAAAANYSMQRYVFTTSTQVLRAGTALMFVLLIPGPAGLLAAVFGLVLGEVLRFGVLLARLPGPLFLRGTGGGALGSAMLRLAGPTMISTAVIAVNPLIDKTVAAHTALGGPTMLELAEKVFYVPSVLLAAAISKVSAGHWARMAAERPQDLPRDYRITQIVAISVSSLAALVVAVTLVVLGKYTGLVDRVLGGVTSEFLPVILVFLVGLPFALSSDLSNTMIINLRKSRVMPKIAVILVVINIIGDVLGALLFGIPGIAASSTFVRFSSCLMTAWFVTGFLRDIRQGSQTLQDRPT